MTDDPRLPEIGGERNTEKKDTPYQPRPKWQLALAWGLVALMILTVLGSYYWMIRGV